MQVNPFEPITFTIEEINPYQPEVGKGGFNSGVNLEKYQKTIGDRDERNRRSNENAQRTYRNRNRDAYNANMNKLWNANKAANNDSYKTWKANQAIANKNYRLNQLINNPTDRSVNNQLRKLWSSREKKVGRRKKGSPSLKEEKEQFFSANFEKAKQDVIEKYKKDKEAFLAKYPNRDLKDGNVFTPDYELKEYDPTGLEIGREVKGKKTLSGTEIISADANRLHNKKELSDYYRSVLTKDKEIPENAKEWEVGSRKYNANAPAQARQTNYAEKRVRHRKALHAGDWDLQGSYKRNEGATGKRPEDKRNKFEI